MERHLPQRCFPRREFLWAGPRKRARVEKPKKPAKEQRDITKMSAAEKKEIARLRAAIKKEEEELKRKREKVAALKASILADEADDKLTIEE
ncbi:hypothetical protein ASPFODRAFT_212103 [Aspergillus luchuensis CBS 106.47]|uniref:Uncharacterized protein n=1 Tax=Aspergillus luchuensis (strain CBS 106.47) TaxID=1137211 RepID=A0A1M3T258_ASPLC|nr:hypothetical protein ASPFODRAFT_212103 [Aspergillus luchuensis CBS 106.47]